MTTKVRKAPTGAKHDRCIGHVEHPYPLKGMLCYGEVIRRDGMIAFADHLAETRAAHRAIPQLPADGSHARLIAENEPVNGVDAICAGAEVPGGVTACAFGNGAKVHMHPMGADARAVRNDDGLAELVARYRAMRGLPAVETPAPVARKRSARVVAPVKPADPLAAAFAGFARDMLDSGRALGILSPAEPVAPEVLVPSADIIAAVIAPARACTGRRDDGSAVWAPIDTPDDPAVGRCADCGDPIAHLASADSCYGGRWSHESNVVAGAMRALGMLDSTDVDALVTIVEPEPAPDVARVSAESYRAESYRALTADYGAARLGRVWRLFARYDDGAIIGEPFATLTSATVYAQLRQASDDGISAPAPVVETPADTAEDDAYALAIVRARKMAQAPADTAGWVDGLGYLHCLDCADISERSEPVRAGDVEPGAPCDRCGRMVGAEPIAEPIAEPVEPAACVWAHESARDVAECHETTGRRHSEPDTYAAALAVAEAREPVPSHPYRFDDTVRHPGASRIDCADCHVQAPVEPIAEPTAVLSAPSTRPTCERCGQVFRVKGAGADWHRVNRPDCARVAVSV